MDNFDFIKKAHEYASKSHHIKQVSEIKVDEANKIASFTATFILKFPSGIQDATTKFGVRREEPVKFEFNEQFPSKAPFITLRKDFPRDFEHINPNKKVVNPCIYEGNLNELLQQPKFFDEILDQMAVWLDKTTTNTLFNVSQGWEPMRTDFAHGIIEYPRSVAENLLKQNDGINLIGASYKFEKDKFSVTIKEFENSKLNKDNVSVIIPYISERVADKYYPNSVDIYEDLKQFCEKVHINDLDNFFLGYSKELEKVSYVFLMLCVKRPAKVIGRDSNYELLNFAINVQSLQTTKKGAKIRYGAKVYTLSTIESPSQELLAKFSGLSQKSTMKDMIITQIGCGSLGSKIIMHLARTGITDKIKLIDNGVFSSHNHARHGLSNVKYLPTDFKSQLMYFALREMGSIQIKPLINDVKDVKNSIKEGQVLIDSTADISVRNFLMDGEIKSEVIHTVLHNYGRVGLVFIEGKDRKIRIDDIVAEFYLLCFRTPELSELITNNKAQYETVGQGCGSITTIVSDATISLQASAMANIIQKRLEYGSKEIGELYIGTLRDDINLFWNKFDIQPPVILSDEIYNMQVRVSSEVIKKIEAESKLHYPNETGGVLVGHISIVNNVYTIVDLIDATEDSIRKPTYFELGTKGLKSKITEYVEKTNGLLTYIGTWHSHPRGGGPSQMDLNMKKKLMEDREDCPSVCLIYSNGEFITF